MPKTYSDAEALVHEWVASDSLRKHMLSVATALRAYAKKYGEDEETWAICGLLHDFDYERYPEPDPNAQTGHPYEGVRYLREQGYDDNILDAIMGHALYTGTPRNSLLAKCLFACDELCGFIVACGHSRPERLSTLTASSVKKKLKDKRFAAKVSREDIALGISELGTDADEHISFVIEALKPIENQLFN